MGQKNLNVICAEPFQRRLETFSRAFGCEVELGLIEPAGLGADRDFLAPASGERLAKELLGRALAVERGGIDEIDAGVNRRVERIRGFSRFDTGPNC